MEGFMMIHRLFVSMTVAGLLWIYGDALRAHAHRSPYRSFLFPKSGHVGLGSGCIASYCEFSVQMTFDNAAWLL